MESNQQAVHGAPATIVLGGGCFWCTDAVFSQVRGVRAVECGYANGHLPQPRYEQVCTGKTGHAEVVRVQFDPQAITLRELLLIFFATHDPTTRNRQGNDEGPQYRSAIYTFEDSQLREAELAIARFAEESGKKVHTLVLPLRGFRESDERYQNYYRTDPSRPFCRRYIDPKLDFIRRHFSEVALPDVKT